MNDRQREERVKEFFAYCRERYRIMLKKDAGAPGPWTDDPVLQQYRFCNVFREDDRVTRWYAHELRAPLGDDDAAQFRAAVVFRWFNSITTGELLHDLLMPGEWDFAEARLRLKRQVESGKTILGAAYMIKSPPGMDKVDGLLECIRKVFLDIGHSYADPVKEIRKSKSLESAVQSLVRYDYIGPFMAYQMVCDLRYAPILEEAKDVMTWTAPGPGSGRGSSRIVFGHADGYSYNNRNDVVQIMDVMLDLLEASDDASNWPKEWPKWELAQVQHNLCEFDKIMRVRNGEGTPKQLYKPA